ncbi:MAG: hypothetical protein EXS10_00645 [Phycisphaerales bacterium]|nr:hypothetical protein [Phycisphaerales bacterium]
MFDFTPLLLLVPPAAADAVPTLTKAAPLGLVPTLLVYAVTLVGMAAIGWVAWKLVNKQEAADPKFEAKLAADDERVKTGIFAQDFAPRRDTK